MSTTIKKLYYLIYQPGRGPNVGCWPDDPGGTMDPAIPVSYNGDQWTASQWNYNEVPGGPSGAWNSDGAC